MSRTDRHAGPREFITLCAFLMATIALAVDMMLPALDAIALDLSLHDPAQKPGIILSIFAGLVIGQLFFGPLSDAIGRYPSILIGMGIFLVGTVICALSGNYATLIMGRLIQGFGASAARIVTQAMIRDRFSGTEMARVMSFVMTIFIVIPVFAPMADRSFYGLATGTSCLSVSAFSVAGSHFGLVCANQRPSATVYPFPYTTQRAPYLWLKAINPCALPWPPASVLEDC